MKTRVNYLFVLLSVLTFSCSDIFEASIEDKTINIITPGDSISSSNYNQTFWWDEVEGALSYHIQIVSPDFNNTVALYLDSSVKTTKFSYTMRPGTYQWRIRGENGSSTTKYFTRTLIIEEGKLSQQTVLLTAPYSEQYSKGQPVTFSWQPVYGATSYLLEVDTISGNFTGTTKLSQSTPYYNYNYSFPYEGKFIWRVKAKSDTAESNYSLQRTVNIDRTAPDAVNLVSPTSGTNLPKPVTLKWNASTDNIAKYLVDASIVTGTTTSADTTQIGGYPIEVTDGNSYSFKDAVPGNKVIWRVKAVDLAGNEGSYSAYKNFTIGQ